jgi:hypothetical protein
VSELDFSDLIVAIVHSTTGRLASLKLMEIGVHSFVEIGGVQLFDVRCKLLCTGFRRRSGPFPT